MNNEIPGFREIPKRDCPYENGDEFATAVIEHVSGRPQTQTQLIVSPDLAARKLPHLSDDDKEILGMSDHEMWGKILLEHKWSHETRANIVIAKASRPLPYWEVRKSLEILERRGQLEGWLPYK